MGKDCILRDIPENVGISSVSIQEFKDRLYEADLPMHGILIMKDDKLVYEAYQKPFGRNSLHRMFSVTKSFVSLAIGILADEGKIKLDDYIVDYFPEMIEDKVHPYIKAITIRNMLTMTTAHNSTTYKLAGCTDWVKSFFTQKPSHYPGTFFSYDTSSTHTLAALVEKLTGKELLEYLREKVLDDIGFSGEAYCLKDPMGISMGGSGLMAKAMDILKFARLIMAEGNLNGKQYVSKEYIRQAVSKQVDNYAKGGSFEEMQGYGYQFWRTTHNSYVCFGMGGQLGLCIPDKNMILVTIADTQGRNGGVQLIYESFWQTVYKSVESSVGNKADIIADEVETDESKIPVNTNTIYTKSETDYSRITTGEGVADELGQIIIKGNRYSELTNSINNKRIVLDENDKGFEYFEFTFGEEEGSVTYKNKTGEHTLRFGLGKNVETEFPFYQHKALVSGAWTTGNTFVIYAQIIDEYVGKVYMHFSFNGEKAGIMLRKIEETYYKEFELFGSGTL